MVCLYYAEGCAAAPRARHFILSQPTLPFLYRVSYRGAMQLARSIGTILSRNGSSRWLAFCRADSCACD